MNKNIKNRITNLSIDIQVLRNTRHRACLRMGAAILVLTRFGYCFEDMGLKHDFDNVVQEGQNKLKICSFNAAVSEATPCVSRCLFRQT